jgi:hypothetical protein
MKTTIETDFSNLRYLRLLAKAFGVSFCQLSLLIRVYPRDSRADSFPLCVHLTTDSLCRTFFALAPLP